MVLSIKKALFSDLYSITLLFLLSFHLVSNLIWIIFDTAPLPWDQAGHTRIAFHFAEYVKDLGFLRIVDYFSISSDYPPLIHTIAAIPILIFGNPIDIGQITITIFFLFSIVLVYILSLDLFAKKDVAILSAAVYSLLPSVYELSRWFLLEIPLLTFILAAIICLSRSREFSERKYALYFFVFAAFAFLTKWLAFFYLAFPLTMVIYQFLKKPSSQVKGAVDHLLKGLFIFVLLVFPWYVININTLVPDILTNIQGKRVDPGLISLENIIFYIYLFINFQLTLFASILFFISLIFFSFDRLPNKRFILGYIAFIYITFTLISNKDLRYILPIAPFATALIAAFLIKLKDLFKILGYLAIFALIGYLVSNYFLLSFRFPINLTYQRAIKLPIIGWIDYVNINDILAHKYNDTTWPQREILSDVKNLEPQETGFEKIWVIVVSDQERFNNTNLVLEKEILAFDTIIVEPPPQKPSISEQEVKDYLARFKYAIVAKENVVNPATRNVEVLLQFKREIEANNYRKIKDYPLPNKDTITVYQLRP